MFWRKGLTICDSEANYLESGRFLYRKEPAGRKVLYSLYNNKLCKSQGRNDIVKIKWFDQYQFLVLLVFLMFLAACNSILRAPPVDLHEDLRGFLLERNGKDLTRLDLRDSDLNRTTFDSFTRWPASDRLPKGFKPDELMNWGKYPGLGVKQLHAEGITGKGVHVAIIDQPLLKNHAEYRDQLTSYTEIQTGNAGPQMHGPAVASIFVGKTCGVAPGAILHYWAEPSWKRDYQYRCEALERIIEYNKGKPNALQIRVVSVSKGFSRNEPNLGRWKTLLGEATRNGIYVIHCARDMFGVGCLAYGDSDKSANYRLCAFHPKSVYKQPGTLFAPIDNRTTASSEGEEAYIFWSKSGLSWGAPYIAGVAALGIQVNPDLTASDIERLLYESGSDFQKGKLINPLDFIQAVQKLKSTR